MKEKLLECVLAQIVKDVVSGDLTAIEVLLLDIPDDRAIHFLPEMVEKYKEETK